MIDELKGNISDDEWLSFLQHYPTDKVKAAYVEITRLRADLAAANSMLYGTQGEVSTKGAIEEAASFQRAWVAERTRAEKAEADLAAARELLREASDAILPLSSQERRSIWSISPQMMRALAAVYGRIDAALKGAASE